jgi:hypothetical protein
VLKVAQIDPAKVSAVLRNRAYSAVRTRRRFSGSSWHTPALS